MHKILHIELPKKHTCTSMNTLKILGATPKNIIILAKVTLMKITKKVWPATKWTHSKWNWWSKFTSFENHSQRDFDNWNVLPWLMYRTEMQSCENGHFDDQQTADHSRKTKTFIVDLQFVLDICNRNDTKERSKAFSTQPKSPNCFATYRRIEKIDQLQKITIVE